MTLLHIHIPKTGGSTITKMLERHFGDKYYRVPNKQSVTFWDNPVTSQYEVVSGHFTYPVKREGLPEFTYLTFLRNPIDRLLSLYHYFGHNSAGGHRDEIANLSFEEFISFSFPTQELHDELFYFIDNDMVRRISGIGRTDSLVDEQDLEQALEHLEMFPLVGLVEYFNRSVTRLGEFFGWPVLNYGHLLHQPERLGQRELPNRVIGEITERQRYDFALYRAVFERDWLYEN